MNYREDPTGWISQCLSVVVHVLIDDLWRSRSVPLYRPVSVIELVVEGHVYRERAEMVPSERWWSLRKNLHPSHG